MILNDEQKAMLNGDLGEGAAYAMKIQFALGEAFDAQPPRAGSRRRRNWSRRPRPTCPASCCPRRT